MKLKYIMFEVSGNKMPVIFPEFIKHKDVAAHLKRLFNDAFHTHDCAPVSAGFFQTKECITYGDSESLKLESNPEDATIIKVAI